jgi:NAD/NADP transhydrogenase beta subunit
VCRASRRGHRVNLDRRANLGGATEAAEIWARNNTMMLFGDAKKMCEEIVKAME